MAELLTRREAAALVIVVDSGPRRPVYHKRGEWVGDNAYTGCGVSVGFFDAWLPRRLVVKFARPCRRCYPRFYEQLELDNG